jgi:hypothetical protein
LLGARVWLALGDYARLLRLGSAGLFLRNRRDSWFAGHGSRSELIGPMPARRILCDWLSLRSKIFEDTLAVALADQHEPQGLAVIARSSHKRRGFTVLVALHLALVLRLRGNFRLHSNLAALPFRAEEWQGLSG